MGKKGKSKNKLAKMSEEERIRYLQMKADMEEEARRRKQHLISLYMKNKLKKEEAFSRLNMAKINQEWRSILRQLKCQDLKKEMSEVDKYFRMALERKERIIHGLINELEIAEDTYSTLQHSHMETLSQLISCQHDRMEFFKKEYNAEKTAIITEYNEFFMASKATRNKLLVQLECVRYGLEDNTEKQIKQKFEEHLLCMDKIRSETTVRLEEITREREENLEALWQQYQDVLTGYMKHTESFYTDYIELKERDQLNGIIIRDQYREIERATEQIANLKLALINATEDADSQSSYLQKLRNELSQSLTNKRQNFEKQMKFDKEGFKTLGVMSHNTIKALQKMVQKGESLLQLATVCRRFETEREKILPFGLPRKSLFADPVEDLNNPPKDIKTAALMTLAQMEKFWRRVNIARLDVVHLKREKIGLELENEQLKAQLREHLIEMNLNTGSNAHVNDYVAKRPQSMMVRTRPIFETDTPSNRGSSCLQRPYTCIEANLSNAVRSKLLVQGKPLTAPARSFVNVRFSGKIFE